MSSHVHHVNLPRFHLYTQQVFFLFYYVSFFSETGVFAGLCVAVHKHSACHLPSCIFLNNFHCEIRLPLINIFSFRTCCNSCLSQCWILFFLIKLMYSTTNSISIKGINIYTFSAFLISLIW